MSGSCTAVVNLPAIFESMGEALDDMAKKNPTLSLASVIDRIGEDMAQIVSITQGNGGMMKELHDAAWSLAVVSVLHFSMVQASIAHTMRMMPVSLNKGMMH
ncbi:hypothetical protein PY793_04435 [Acetobacter fabarum]|uniref:hypothetical protein n=1 Tax=Acetobacter fabarum TaxID=483199 RepID=UPI00312B7F4A